ncbi:MAG: hypothetical protein D6730_13390 [Bacteroidetes bacterium]|nr:MAG: hypothetical protein D6730_13390 [Bacteroidota bacterium]
MEVKPVNKPQNGAAAPPRSPAAPPAARPKRYKKPEFQIPGNLNEAQQRYQQVRQVQQQAGEEAENTNSYQLNPAVELDKQQFEAALNTYIEQLKASNKMNLASGLQASKSSFRHNEWTLSLGSEIFKNMLERERENLLLFLREKLQIPDLYVRLQIDESLQQSREHKPYTQEEKLKEMARKNPSVKKLQEIFKTRIIY